MISKRVTTAWLCLLTGISIYLLFRSRQHLGFVLVDMMGMGSIADSLRASVTEVNPPDFVRYCLPDGLWTTSYILFTDRIFNKESVKTRTLWVSIIPLIGIISELLQLFGILPGVFDSLDLMAYTIPIVMYMVI